MGLGAVGAGIEPAEGALTVRPVFQHTSPTRPDAAPCEEPRPPYTGDRHAHQLRAVTPLRIVKDRGHTLAFAVSGAGLEPTFRVSETLVLPLDDPEVRSQGIEPSPAG